MSSARNTEEENLHDMSRANQRQVRPESGYAYPIYGANRDSSARRYNLRVPEPIEEENNGRDVN